MSKTGLENMKEKLGKPVRGKKETAITPKEFRDFLHSFYGGRGAHVKFAELTGLNPNTVARYSQGVRPIPEHIALILSMMKLLRGYGFDVIVNDMKDFSKLVD